MPADIIVSPTTQRSYSVPTMVSEAAREAIKTVPSAAGHRNYQLALKLSETKKADLNDIFEVHSRCLEGRAAGLVASGSLEDSGYRLLGGQEGQDWASRIVRSVRDGKTRDRERELARIGYDPGEYAYYGLATTADEDLITHVLRSEARSIGLAVAETLQKDGTWRAFDFDENASPDAHGVVLEPDLLAFTASAISEGVRAIKLAYGEPLLFLEEPPMLASGAPDVAVGGFVYAIVDAADTTAIMDVIKIEPGPIVSRRSAGKWTVDVATLDALMSANPPPIVELSGDILEGVLEQIDGAPENKLDVDDAGVATEGVGFAGVPVKPGEDPATGGTAVPQKAPEKFEEPEPDTEEGRGSRGGVVASLVDARDTLIASAAIGCADAISAARREYVLDGGHLVPVADIESLEETKKRLTALKARKIALEAVTETRDRLTRREKHLTNVAIPVANGLLASNASETHGASSDQRKAEPLRKYWLHGVGAVKIAWGTSGDFTRCVRQLRPYLGDRTNGYCQLRHKEANGFYTGDRRNE